MYLTYDYFNHLESSNIYLCNPDGSFLYPVLAYEKKATIRLNDLSDFSCDIYKSAHDMDCKTVSFEAYDYIQAHRQIYVEGLGWFVMNKVEEHDDGTVCYKSISAQSLQVELGNKGIYSEERVYCLYNDDDPIDTYYDSDDDAGLPSVVGQLYRQLDIQLDLTQGQTPPSVPYSFWTIVYISGTLHHSIEIPGICRTLEDGVNTGYSFMISTVQEAFSVIFVFDFQYRTIQILDNDDVTTDSNLLISFNNLMKEVEVKESTDDLVTVLNCEGQDCDISPVNPTGTRYICNFDYYKATQSSAPWMSAALTDVINMWESAVSGQQTTYSALVTELRLLYRSRTYTEERLQYFSLFLTDLKNCRDKYVDVAKTNPSIDVTALKGVITCEKLDISEYPNSYLSTSAFYSTTFTPLTSLTCYKEVTYNETNRVFVLTGGAMTGTATDCFNAGYLYFADDPTMASYCKLTATAKVNVDDNTAEYTCNGFERYGRYDLVVPSNSHVCWIDDIYEPLVDSYNIELDALDNSVEDPDVPGTFDGIKEVQRKIQLINDTCNIFKWIKGNFQPSVASEMLRELACYWIEGDYTNNNIKILESTTPAEEMELCQELYESGQRELEKISSPKLTFDIEANDLSRNIEFKDQMNALQLGSIITVEKEEGVWYFPALIEMSFDLDHNGDLTLGFATSLKLDEVTFTIADLISKSAVTTKKVEANWGNFTNYSKDKDFIMNVTNAPLDLTLRAATANMVNQEFTVDDTGILGRKRSTTVGDIFDPEQIRMTNNVIMFTNNSWETIKTALGKITYTESIPGGGSVTRTAYGLIADTIIGNLILGSAMKIQNNLSTVIIDVNGIMIKHGLNTVFRADTEGNVYLDGYITSDALQAYAKKQDGTNGGFGYILTPTQFSMGAATVIDGQVTITSEYLGCNSSGITINGYLSQADAQSTYETLTDAADKAYKEGGTANSFSYSLLNTGFTMKRYINGSMVEVFKVDGNGMAINGYLSEADAQSTYETQTDAANKANKEDGTTNSFSYALLNTGFSMKMYNGSSMVEVFKCDSTGLTINGSGTFSGSLSAAKGTFGYPSDYGDPGSYDNCLFTIGTTLVNDNPINVFAPVIYTTGGQDFAGMGAYGTVLNNTTHIGGDGWSIKVHSDYATDYTTSIRPGYTFNSGRSSSHPRATMVSHSGIDFFFDPDDIVDLALSASNGYRVAGFTIDENSLLGEIDVSGVFEYNNTSSVNFLGNVSLGSGSTLWLYDLVRCNSAVVIGTVTYGTSSNSATVTMSRYSTVDYQADSSVTMTKTNLSLVGTLVDCTPSGNINAGLTGDFYITTAGRVFDEQGQIVITSDRRKKRSITKLDNKYDLFFDNLNPVSFEYKSDNSGRVKVGFVAQDVDEALKNANLNPNRKGMITEYQSGGETRLALSYNDFIALNTYEIQKLKKRIKELEALIKNK